MRLTCPECGAVYEAADSEIPTEGRHVQCTACHTRWFARKPAAEEVTEDDIIARLESRRPKLRAVPDPSEDEGDADDGDFEWEGAPETAAEPSRIPPATPSSGIAAFPAPGGSAIPQPRPVPDRRSETAAPDLGTQRHAHRDGGLNDTRRLDLTREATRAAEAVRRDRGGFRRGLIIGVALILAALALYLLARPVAGSVPLAGGYVALIDGLRSALAVATQT